MTEKESMALLPELPPSESKWHEVHKQAWKDGDGSIAEQVDATGLRFDQKINLIEHWKRHKELAKSSGFLENVNLWSMALQAVLSALVPILVPLAQDFKGRPLTILWVKHEDGGAALSEYAVACSLISTLIYLIHRNCKWTDRARNRLKQKEMLSVTLQRFLAKAGKYKDFEHYVDAYPFLLDELCMIEEFCGDSKFFGRDDPNSKSDRLQISKGEEGAHKKGKSRELRCNDP
mmetsp:Transcript_42654/g.74149  ORF Transcript_42654/g.74149 Transcript_42654/m.74149 type:complete len:233 (+) Transcript_42654:89-787(+)